MESTYFSLATKQNFNKALRHFYKVTDVVDELEDDRNLADVINEELDENEIHIDQVLPIVGAVIRDKLDYSYDSYNIPKTVNEFDKIVTETNKWTALDIVLVYYNPSDDVVLINPKNTEHWEKTRELHQDLLCVVYVKYLKEEDKTIERDAINALEEMISGKDVFTNKKFIDATRVAKTVVKKKVEPAAAPSKGKHNITPKYSVQVTNELFHNGNVEAWKKIIESYMHKFPELEVSVFFEGEIINDLNALFKWGKVNHGDHILFQIAGENILGVSKLQKYLFEGASPRFEQFLKIGVGQILNLF